MGGWSGMRPEETMRQGSKLPAPSCPPQQEPWPPQPTCRASLPPFCTSSSLRDISAELSCPPQQEPWPPQPTCRASLSPFCTSSSLREASAVCSAPSTSPRCSWSMLSRVHHSPASVDFERAWMDARAHVRDSVCVVRLFVRVRTVCNFNAST